MKFKRGLSHAHILLWLDDENKLQTVRDIDRIICVELPHLDLYPKLSKAVASYIIHGPCGAAKFNSPCMKKGRCSKFYSKKFTCSTTIEEDGYPSYRRRDNGIFVKKKWN